MSDLLNIVKMVANLCDNLDSVIEILLIGFLGPV